MRGAVMSAILAARAAPGKPARAPGRATRGGRRPAASPHIHCCLALYLARATARLSSSLPILERPLMSSRRASASSSLRVGDWPLRTAFASLPRAVRVFAGGFLRVCLLRAPACAFLTLRLAASRCLVVAMRRGYPEVLDLITAAGLGHPQRTQTRAPRRSAARSPRGRTRR